MKLLLDSHIFLRYILGDQKLKSRHRSIITEQNNEAFLSIACLWEICVKQDIGKLTLPRLAAEYVPLERKLHNIILLNLDEKGFGHLHLLPSLHGDPFDRMLICQALEHDMIIVTDDKLIKRYPVKTI